MRFLRALSRLAMILCLAGCGAGSESPAEARGDKAWVGAWMAAQGVSDLQGFTDQSLRMILQSHQGGSTLRLRFANHYGQSPVTLESVHIGRRGEGAAVVTGTQVAVRFSGASSLSLAPGEEVRSDPLRFDLAPFEDLAVSFHLSGATGAASSHSEALQTSYTTARGTGDRAADESATAYTETRSHWYYLTGIDVQAGPATAAVIALGDSITDGSGNFFQITKPGDGHHERNGRWPDVLARRMAAVPAYAQYSVLNAGIGGNRLLTDAPFGIHDPLFGAGDSALRRLQRDVLDVPGACTVIVLIGINDIGIPLLGRPPLAPFASADEMIAGYREIIRRAHERGLRVLGGTLTPTIFLLHGEPLRTGVRAAVNEWIRNSGEYDGVIDFDAAVRDPDQPERLRPEFSSGDGLHPSLAGYEAMGQAIDLSVMGCGPGRYRQ
ncbi:MAG TPA: SGNH/GDSL hydrolase family protein [Solimonas sp.]|nr:SGNH/GDSL hydrolase family protein [Solimonas sp.]